MNHDFEILSEIKWPIHLPNGETLLIYNSLHEEEEEENSYLTDNRDFSYHPLFDNDPFQQNDDNKVLTLDILQDFFYVIWLKRSKEHGEKRMSILNYQDECWDALRVSWRCLLELMKEKRENLYNNQDSEKREILFRLKGNSYRKFINNMGEPYATRYLAYRIMQPLFQVKSKSKMTLGYCTDIVCNHIEFINFWNQGINQFASVLNRIEKTNRVNKLREILDKITAGIEYKKFRERYTSENGSCFMLANVKFPQYNKTVLCFSGVKFKGSIKKAIEIIMQSNYFKNAYLVQVPDNIRYYLPTGQYITYGEAKEKQEKCDIKYNPRMFSCCERKTFAAISWKNCQSYEMIVKYSPCELCQKQVKDFEQKYHGNTIWGKKCLPLGDKKDTFDKIAMAIYILP